MAVDGVQAATHVGATGISGPALIAARARSPCSGLPRYARPAGRSRRRIQPGRWSRPLRHGTRAQQATDAPSKMPAA